MTEPARQLTYGSYLRVDDLLALQHPHKRPEHPDELLFIITHQAFELWFKQILHELREFKAHLGEGDPTRATHLLGRVTRIVELMITQFPVLETMFAVEFAAFRDALGTASGFQSRQFREVEYLLGAKQAWVLESSRLRAELGIPDERAEAMRNEPSIYDAALAHLVSTGRLGLSEADIERDVTKPHELNPRVVDALARLYSDAAYEADVSKRHRQEFLLCEALVELDERFAELRFQHVMMAKRMIGMRRGTGGSSGVDYLQRTVQTELFPDLWAVRATFGKPYGQMAEPVTE